MDSLHIVRNTDHLELNEIEVSPYIPANWYTPEGANKKFNLLKKKGLPQFQDWRFITLTVDQLKFKNSQSAYCHIKKNFRYFIRDLKSYLGIKTLRWISKLEFQQNGFVHWHMLIDYRKPIDVSMLAEIWGYGLVHIARNKERDMPYTFKYISKSVDGLPKWFLELSRPRVFQSSGIFPKEQKKVQKSEQNKDKKPSTTLGDRLISYSKSISYRTRRGKYPIRIYTAINWQEFLCKIIQETKYKYVNIKKFILPDQYLTQINNEQWIHTHGCINSI